MASVGDVDSSVEADLGVNSAEDNGGQSPRGETKKESQNDTEDVFYESMMHEKYCFAQCSLDDDQMVGCDGRDCRISWFHLQCVGLTPETVPKGSWYCPDCSKDGVGARSKTKSKGARVRAENSKSRSSAKKPVKM